MKKGLVRSIGISNFNAEQVERVLKNCEIKPVVNQVRQLFLLMLKKQQSLTLHALRFISL